MTDPRQHAHHLIDRMPETQLSALVGLMETIVDPVAAALRNAPLDDEPFTEDDRLAVAEADEWLKQHDPIPLEAVLADFGLNMADWDKMGETPAPDEPHGNV